MDQLTDQQHDDLARAAAEFSAAFANLVQAVAPAVLALGQQLVHIQKHLISVGVLDADGRPTRPADRPAWQTPYGPPQTRH